MLLSAFANLQHAVQSTGLHTRGSMQRGFGLLCGASELAKNFIIPRGGLRVGASQQGKATDARAPSDIDRVSRRTQTQHTADKIKG